MWDCWSFSPLTLSMSRCCNAQWSCYFISLICIFWWWLQMSFLSISHPVPPLSFVPDNLRYHNKLLERFACMSNNPRLSSLFPSKLLPSHWWLPHHWIKATPSQSLSVWISLPLGVHCHWPGTEVWRAGSKASAGITLWARGTRLSTRERRWVFFFFY